MELGEKIKTLRLLSKMTQEELAKQLEVSSQAVSKWENGTCAPDIYMLPKISVVFGVTIDELFDMTIDDKLKRIENMLCSEALIAECEGKRADAESCIEKLLDRYGNEGHVLFSAAGFYADRGEYGKALKLFEESFEKNEKPRFTDELEAQAIIYEILGQYDDAINCHERILTCLAEEWGTTEGVVTDRERNKIAELTLLMNNRK